MTKKIPKSLIVINEKEFLEYVLRSYSKNFERIFLLTGFLGEYFKKYENEKTIIINEKERLGTGGAMINALEKVGDEFVLVNGDTIVNNLKMEKFLEFAKDKKAAICLVEDESSEKGTVLMENGKITKFSEKEESGKGKVYAGIVYFKKKVLGGYNVGNISLEKRIFTELIKKGELYGFLIQGKIYDIGTDGGLEDFKKYVQEGNV